MRRTRKTTQPEAASVLDERLRSFLEENGPSPVDQLIDCFLGRTSGNRRLASALLRGYLGDHPHLFKRDGDLWQLAEKPALESPPCGDAPAGRCLLLIEKGPPDAPFALGLVRLEPNGRMPWMVFRARRSKGILDFLALQDEPEEGRLEQTAGPAGRRMASFIGGSELWYLGRPAELLRVRRLWDFEELRRPVPFWPVARRLLGLPVTIRPAALAGALGLPSCDDDAESPAGRLRWWMEALRQVISRLAAQSIESPAAVLGWLAQPAAAPDFSSLGFDRSDLLAVPEQPGVYCFHDRSGRLLYVGKAKNLRRRLLSYFQPGSAARARKRFLLTKIHSFEYHSLSSDLEALVSESRLIREFTPALNIQQSVRSPQAGYFAMNPAIAVFPCLDRESTLELWCLCPGRRARQLVFKDTPAELPRMRQALSRIYGRPARRRKVRPDSESLLVASWLHRNRQAANWIDVQKLGDIEEILRQLRGYAAAGRDLTSQRILFR